MNFSDDDVFDWGDYKASVYSVIVVLQEHERLHHGQLITYFTLAELEFPKNFKRIGICRYKHVYEFIEQILGEVLQLTT